ncbi:MAG TPA: hypothetical protein VEA99_03975, partial [Gemmatimonadaceae bacterium]|nr:hypothetical protein [Gemmatimonadaceae bacterium]
FVKEHAALQALFADGRAHWVRAPNAEAEGSPAASAALQHGAFDEDRATLLGTLARITSVAAPGGAALAGVPAAQVHAPVPVPVRVPAARRR